MGNFIDPALIRRFTATTAGVIGLAVLAGWALDVPMLKSIIPNSVAMQPWTAVAIVLGAGALRLAVFPVRAVRAASIVSALALALVAAVPLAEYAIGYNLGTDTLLFKQAVLSSQTFAYPNPGRLSQSAAFGLLAIAGALLATQFEKANHVGRAGDALAILAAAFGVAGVLNYVFHVTILTTIWLQNPLSLPTAFGLMLLALGTRALSAENSGAWSIAARSGEEWIGTVVSGAALLLIIFALESASGMNLIFNNAREAAVRLDTLLSTLKDAETGQRGYLLTGQPEYLEPYNEALRRVPGDLAAVLEGTGLDEQTVANLQTLRDLTDRKFAELAQTIARYRAGDEQGALAVVNTGTGKAAMDAVRDKIAALKAATMQTAESARRSSRWNYALAGLGAMGFAAVVAWELASMVWVKRREALANLADAQQRDLLATLALGNFMTHDLDGTIRFWADGCMRLYGWTAEEAVGRSSHELLQTVFPVPRSEIEATLENEGAWTGDMRHRTRDGREVIVTAYKLRRRQAITQSFVILEALVDVTAQRKAEADLREKEALLRVVIESTPGLIYAKDRQGRMILANQAVTALVGKPWAELEGRLDREFLDDPAQGDAVMANDRAIMETGISQELEELVDGQDGQPRVWLSTKTPMRNASDEVIGLVGVSVEITERKRFEDRLQLMINELNHRVKNTLATVQSIAFETLRNGDQNVFHTLDSRYRALAAAHDVLTREVWNHADLNDVIHGALSPHGGINAAWLEVSGPALRLQPRAAVAISMAMHELLKNAMKYGALSVAKGRVSIRWCCSDGNDPRFQLVWSEHDGPAVCPPKLQGFGSRLIERSLAHDLRGRAKIAFDPDGVTCTIDAPVKDVIASAEVIMFPQIGVMKTA